MSGYEARILADSLSPAGVRLTTLSVTMPRIVLAEFNTHRMLSRNSASSRAIPVETWIAAVRANPFVPAAFARNKKGMQAGDVFCETDQDIAEQEWLAAMVSACSHAEHLARLGVHKQWANRLIEPFSWTEVVTTATEWSNFFHLRISEHAQPEIRSAAEAMWAAILASEPRSLALGEWHLPLVNDEDRDEFRPSHLARLSAARCARVSYLTHDGRRDPVADIALHDKLLTDGHMSPFEHPARAEDDRVFRGNFRGFTQLRKTIPREDDRLAT